jgi:3D (Asp-Asp-Asp) domain-containing protein
MRRFAYTLVAIAALTMVGQVSAIQSGQDPKVRTEVERIPYEVKYVFDRDMGAGRLKKVQHGVDGEIVRTYVVSEDGESPGESVLLKEVRKEPVPAIFHMGKPNNRAVSRGAYTRAKVVEMESTAYLPSAGLKNPTFRTATGTKAEYGAIAVDPKVIPMGTLMYVEGYGFGIAEDTGGAIRGNRIDVCIEDRSAAMAWGRRKVKVHIFHKTVELPSEGSSKSTG